MPAGRTNSNTQFQSIPYQDITNQDGGWGGGWVFGIFSRDLMEQNIFITKESYLVTSAT